MKHLLLLFAILLVTVAAQKKAKPPEVELISSKAARTGGVIAVDGRVKNVTGKSIRKPLIYLDFMAADNRVLTTKHGPVGPEELAPGEETEFNLQLEDDPKAVAFRVTTIEDGGGRELRMAEPKKQAIE